MKKRIHLKGKLLSSIRQRLLAMGYDMVEERPDLVISYGGDGALLGAERHFPGIPKLPIRDIETAPHCPKHGLDMILEGLRAGTLSETELMKVTGIANGRRTTGINDVFIHTRLPTSALRYSVQIDDERYAEEIFGDGAGLATPHGSTAYYKSITGSLFRVGLGLAFNNSTEQVNHLVLPEESVVKIRILRGPAILMSDNSTDVIHLDNGDEAVLRKADEKAKVLGLDIFMCPQCRLLRHSRMRGMILERESQNGG